MEQLYAVGRFYYAPYRTMEKIDDACSGVHVGEEFMGKNKK